MRSNLLRLAVLVLLAGGCAGEISEMPTWVGFQEDNVTRNKLCGRYEHPVSIS